VVDMTPTGNRQWDLGNYGAVSSIISSEFMA
jgi:hypothetical protein